MPEAAATVVGTRHLGVVVESKTVLVAVLKIVTTLWNFCTTGTVMTLVVVKVLVAAVLVIAGALRVTVDVGETVVVSLTVTVGTERYDEQKLIAEVGGLLTHPLTLSVTAAQSA